MSCFSVVAGHRAGTADAGDAAASAAAGKERSVLASRPPSARRTPLVTGPSHHSAKSPASTVATPSSVLAGATWSAASRTVWWALATAYDVPAQVSIGMSLGMSPN